MANIKDLTGKRIGDFLILERKRENRRTYYYCECSCGNTEWLRDDSIKRKGNCGCKNKDTKFKSKNLKGNRYGRLTVLRETEKRDKHNECVIWECKCNCGNTCYISSGRLLSKKTRSCGCLNKEAVRKNMRKAVEAHLKKNIAEGTNIPVISNKELLRNNTSGVTGVSWDSTRNKWRATITFQKKVYYLGRYKDKGEATRVRKDAEDNIFGEFLKWYNEFKEKEK